MKPAPFLYLDPPTLDEVLDALAHHGDDAAVIAGGQSLVPLMNLRLARPEVVIDPRRVDGLDAVEIDDGHVAIGALVTATQLLDDARVAELVPGLVEAVAHIGHSQIRNRTTIGGSVAHADPAAELPAALLGLDGEVELASVRGRRVVAAADFFDGSFGTTRLPDELVTVVRFPTPSGPTAWAEVARRPGDFALVGLFATVTTVDGHVAEARLALSGVSDRPVRAPAAEATLAGQAVGPLPEAVLAACAEALRAELSPPDDLHATGPHRAAMAAALARRILPRLTA